MHKAAIIFGSLIFFFGSFQVYNYLADYNSLAAYGKGFVWGNGFLMVLGFSMVYLGLKKGQTK
jgi:hypothetical protein